MSRRCLAEGGTSFYSFVLFGTEGMEENIVIAEHMGRRITAQMGTRRLTTDGTWHIVAFTKNG